MTDIYVMNDSRSGNELVDGWMNEAVQHFRQGRFEQADALLHKVNAAAPLFAEAFNLAAAIAIQIGRSDRAVELLQQAIRLDGTIREHHHNLGTVMRSLGRPREAADSFSAALRLAPDAVDSLFELALCQLVLGVDQGAERGLRTLVAFAPEIAESYHHIGILQLQRENNIQAIACFRRAILCEREYTDAHTNLAILLRESSDFSAAQFHFRLAAALRPDDAFIHSNLGSLQRDLGLSEECCHTLEHAIALAPDAAEFHYSLAVSRSFRKDDPRLKDLERLAQKLPALDRRAKIDLHFALAKAYEDLGDAERSFVHQRDGNLLKRAEIDYDESAMMRGIARIKQVFSQEFFDRLVPANEPSDRPIFVLGMPRSGSTLIEQILASHRKVFGAGELPDLPLLARQLGPEQGPYFPEIVPSLSPEELLALGSHYLAGLAKLAPDAARIVDKLPENFRLIGLIFACLPKARIIHSRRDPIDSCLSIYSKLFTAPMPYSYDLGEIGRYWRAYEDLMAHWRAVLPAGHMLEVDYEALIADQERETRRMLDFCGLDWDPACLEFHLTRRQVKTASALQVRKPLYNSSVGRWRPAAAILAPLTDALAGAGQG